MRCHCTDPSAFGKETEKKERRSKKRKIWTHRLYVEIGCVFGSIRFQAFNLGCDFFVGVHEMWIAECNRETVVAFGDVKQTGWQTIAYFWWEEKNYRINLELFEQLLWCLHDYCHDICMNSLLLSSLLSLFFCIKNHNIWRKCTANEHIIYHKMHGNGREMHFGPKNSRAESVWSIVIFLVYSFILRIATSHEYRVIWYNQPQSRKGWIRNGLRDKKCIHFEESLCVCESPFAVRRSLPQSFCFCYYFTLFAVFLFHRNFPFLF